MTKRLRELEKRVEVLERHLLRLTLEGNRSLYSQHSRRPRTAKQAVVQALEDAGRNMLVLEIQAATAKLTGRSVAKQTVIQYLSKSVRDGYVERVVRGLYRRSDKAIVETTRQSADDPYENLDPRWEVYDPTRRPRRTKS